MVSPGIESQMASPRLYSSGTLKTAKKLFSYRKLTLILCGILLLDKLQQFETLLKKEYNWC